MTGKLATAGITHRFSVALHKQARMRVENTLATYASMYVGKTATATPWQNIAMEFTAVG